MKRPLNPAPTPDERKRLRATTWKVLIVGVVANLVGTCARQTVVRTAGAMPRPRTAAPIDLELHETGKLAPPRGVGKG